MKMWQRESKVSGFGVVQNDKETAIPSLQDGKAGGLFSGIQYEQVDGLQVSRPL